MTRDELNRRRMMFQIYSNRNKMPQLQKNANEEPVVHSATNDFLEYRKKVAAGTRMQRENNTSNLFNVTAANEQYHQDLMDQNIIIHAGMNNQYIAKLDDFYGKGKPRYFYDQAEWDNYRKNMQGAGQTGADRGAREGADAKNKALANRAQQSFTNAVEKDSKNKDLVNKAQEAFNNNANTEFKTNTGVYKNKNFLESNQKNRENAIKRSTPEYQKELEKAKTIKGDKERWAAYSPSDLDDVVNDRRFKNIKTTDDAVNYPGGIEKLYNDLEAALEEKHPGKKKNYEASKNAGADRGAKESEAVNSEKEKKANDRAKKLEEQQNKKEEAAKSGTKTTESYTEQVKRNTDFAKEVASTNDDGSLNEEGKEYVDWVKNETLKDLKTPERHQMEKDIVKDATKPGTTIEDLSSKYGIPASDIRTVLWFNGIKKPAEDKRDLDTRRHNNAISNKWNKEDAIKKSSKGVKHSSLEDGVTTSDDITSDQEYLNFRARVEAGMKHFGMTRGLMSVPVNQALKNGESLSHAGMTNKYYAKLDDFWGKGKPRYFYSKEEWDGYQRNKQGAGQAEAARGAKDHAKVAGEIAARKEKAIKDVQSYKEATSKTSDDTKNYFKNIDNTALAEKANTAYNKAWTDSKRNKFLNDAQGGREAAIKNSGSFVKSSDDGNTKVTVTIEKTPEIVQKAQSGREAAEKEATKRTMTTMAYDKAVKDYQEVAKEIDKEYGFDKLDPTDSKAVNKTWQKLIKDTAKVIDSGKVDNPNNVKYEYQLKDDDANSYAWAAYIQDYASESLRLNSIYNDLQNEYAKTLQTAQAMHDFDAIAESNRHASELFDQMENVRNQMNELKKESDAKVLPYLAAVYKELL